MYPENRYHPDHVLADQPTANNENWQPGPFYPQPPTIPVNGNSLLGYLPRGQDTTTTGYYPPSQDQSSLTNNGNVTNRSLQLLYIEFSNENTPGAFLGLHDATYLEENRAIDDGRLQENSTYGIPIDPQTLNHQDPQIPKIHQSPASFPLDFLHGGREGYQSHSHQGPDSLTVIHRLQTHQAGNNDGNSSGGEYRGTQMAQYINTQLIQRAARGKGRSAGNLTGVNISEVRNSPNGDWLEYRESLNNNWEPAIRHADIRANLLWEADQEASRYGGYDFEPAAGHDLTDRTSFVRAHKTWGPERNNRPEINFVFDKPNNGHQRQLLVNSQSRKWIWNNYVVLDHNDEAMNDFDDCPKVLSAKVEGFRLDAIKKRNPQIRTEDFWARLPREHTVTSAKGIERIFSRMTIQQFTNVAWRWRQKALCLSWSRRAGWEDTWHFMKEFLTPQQLRDNTTRGCRDLTDNQIKELKSYLASAKQARKAGRPVPLPPQRNVAAGAAPTNAPGNTNGSISTHTAAQNIPQPTMQIPSSVASSKLSHIPGYFPSSSDASGAPISHIYPEIKDTRQKFYPRSVARNNGLSRSGISTVIAASSHSQHRNATQKIALNAELDPATYEHAAESPTSNLAWNLVLNRPLSWDSVTFDTMNHYQLGTVSSNGQKRKHDAELDQQNEGSESGPFNNSEGEIYQQNATIGLRNLPSIPASSGSLAVPASKKRGLGSTRTDPSVPTFLYDEMAEEDQISEVSPIQEEVKTPEVITDVTVEPGQEPTILPIGEPVSFFLPDGKVVNKAVMTGTDNTIWTQQHAIETIAILEAQQRSDDQPVSDEPLFEPTPSQLQSAPTEPWLYEVPSGMEVTMFPIGAKVVVMCRGAIRVGVIAPNGGTSWSILSKASAIQLLRDIEARSSELPVQSKQIIRRQEEAQIKHPAISTASPSQQNHQDEQATSIDKENLISAESLDELFEGSDRYQTPETSPESNLLDQLPTFDELKNQWSRSNK